MPRYNGRHISMEEYERLEHREEMDMAEASESFDRAAWRARVAREALRIRAEYVKLQQEFKKQPVAWVTEIAKGEGLFVEKLIEKHGFKKTLYALKAASPSAKALFEKYKHKWERRR